MNNNQIILYVYFHDTPLGSIKIVADNEKVYYIGFVDRVIKNSYMHQYFEQNNILHESNNIIIEVCNQLNDYFNGQLIQFSIPLYLFGTLFQKKFSLSHVELYMGIQNHIVILLFCYLI